MPTIDEIYKHIDVREGLDSDGVGVSVCALYMPPKDIEGNDTMPLNLAYLREHETTAEEASRRSRQNRTAKMEEGQIKVTPLLPPPPSAVPLRQ